MATACVGVGVAVGVVVAVAVAVVVVVAVAVGVVVAVAVAVGVVVAWRVEMTEEQIALARRAVACKGWRWMPGMRAVGKFPNYPVRIHAFGENVQDPDDMLAADKWLPWQQPVEYGDHIYDGPYLPDLTDPATLGCLLALVREVYGEATAHTRPFKGHWLVEREDRPYLYEWLRSCGTWGEGNGHVVDGDSEAEALVAALEAAP